MAEAKAAAKDSDRASDKTPHTRMVINYVPGEECRIAIVEDGKLEEYYAEPVDEVSRVNNIYIGRVTNVESSIQAAFVDFGLEENGFLHTSDLHPKHFEGDDSTERVGHKTPRRERPPIQHCLKRGQQIAVQVLKEGVGTKGPTLTSYLSIPGRFLVMMPDMDKVGVSRKVEDEDTRKKMKQILDQLELPEGFGFILRTAGLDRTKAEIKRDLAYLQRLWKDMETRRKRGTGKPRLLYSESDLLVRSLRDLMSKDIDEVVIDHPSALTRAERFMKIVSPRASTKLMQYTGDAPIFHAFGIEPQILNIHAREVPLPSGGRLVIDETEALVAIDVNSGKSKAARDAETNAYNTNLEAADEICRQLRLRDLGGLVIHDLIDMRHASHRKAVEQRFKDRLKRDRAKTTVLPISGFGIMEMTRQRMRGSHEKTHFAECPTCRGRGLVQRSHSVAADALREMAQLLTSDRIARVEMVVHPRIAAALLSTKRRLLTRIERASGKSVDVRLSDSIPIDRVSFYAYDQTGADIAIDRLPRPRGDVPVEHWESEIEDADSWAVDLADEASAEVEADEIVDPLAQAEEELADTARRSDQDSEDGEGKKKKKRRRRRRRRKSDEGATDEASDESAGERSEDDADRERPAAADRSSDERRAESATEDDRAEIATSDDTVETEGGTKKKRRRRRRRRRSGEGDTANEQAAAEQDDAAATTSETQTEDAQSEQSESNDTQSTADQDSDGQDSDGQDSTGQDSTGQDSEGQDSDEPATKKKRSSSRRGRSSKKKSASAASGVEPSDNEPSDESAADADTSSEPTGEQADADEPPKRTRKRSTKRSTKKSGSKANANDEADDGADAKPAAKKRRSTKKSSSKSPRLRPRRSRCGRSTVRADASSHQASEAGARASSSRSLARSIHARSHARAADKPPRDRPRQHRLGRHASDRGHRRAERARPRACAALRGRRPCGGTERSVAQRASPAVAEGAHGTRRWTNRQRHVHRPRCGGTARPRDRRRHRDRSDRRARRARSGASGARSWHGRCARKQGIAGRGGRDRHGASAEQRRSHPAARQRALRRLAVPARRERWDVRAADADR